MNKEAQNYLSKNKQSRIVGVKVFIPYHKTDLKHAVILCLAATIIISMLTGCNISKNKDMLPGIEVTVTNSDGKNIKPEKGETMFPLEQPEKSEEEINATGIQVEDIKAVITNICYGFFYYQMNHLDEGYHGFNFDNMSCTFDSFGGDYYLKTGGELDVYSLERAPYFELIERGYIGDKKFWNYYTVSLDIIYNVEHVVKELRIDCIPIPADIMDDLMSQLNIPQTTVTYEYRQNLNYYKKPRIDTKIYEINPNLITIKTIDNANQEQLDAMYKFLIAIKYYQKTGELYK